jgi:3-phenylpropionate/trans-cinnamate dioxygenase ferredoxin reductase subunit
MLGKGTSYAPVPYFWSDQYAFNLQYVGHASGGDEVVFRGAVTEEAWSAFYLRDGRLRAALAVNRPRERAAARQLIARQTPVTARQLADERVDLRSLAANSAA